MDKKEIIELLDEIAVTDLHEGSDIYDHPCSVAVRAINQAFNDAEFLRGVCNGKAIRTSKKARMLLSLRYNPHF